MINLRVLDKYGSGTTSAVIAALEYAVANKARLGIHIINLSLGHPIYEPAATDPLVQAVEAAVRAGIVVVVSAGNVGISPATGKIAYGGITSPGHAPPAITVGAGKTPRHERARRRPGGRFDQLGPENIVWGDNVV